MDQMEVLACFTFFLENSTSIMPVPVCTSLSCKSCVADVSTELGTLQSVVFYILISYGVLQWSPSNAKRSFFESGEIYTYLWVEGEVFKVQ